MKATNTLELMKLSSECPLCGNKYIGNGKGKLEVEDFTFKRTCICGWIFEAVEEDGVIKIIRK